MPEWLDFDDNDIEYYTAGNCWSLAWQLNQQSGWPIYTLGRTPTKDGGMRLYTSEDWDHVVVKHRNKYLDLVGLHFKADIEKEWSSKLRRLPVVDSRDEYRRQLFGEYWWPGYRDWQPGHTVAVARRLIRHVNLLDSRS